jgi:hypothetical protein
MAINPNTDFTAGAIFTADQANRFPRGILSFTELGANVQTALSTTIATAITGASFTIASTRQVLITGALGLLDAQTTSQIITQQIWDASAAVYTNIFINDNQSISAPIMQRAFVLTAGTYTFRLRCTLNTGTNRTNSGGGGLVSTYIYATDLGPA